MQLLWICHHWRMNVIVHSINLITRLCPIIKTKFLGHSWGKRGTFIGVMTWRITVLFSEYSSCRYSLESFMVLYILSIWHINCLRTTPQNYKARDQPKDFKQTQNMQLEDEISTFWWDWIEHKESGDFSLQFLMYVDIHSLNLSWLVMASL